MQLSFLYNFEQGGDEVFCCYTIPYSYTDMQLHLEHIKKSKNAKVESIGQSIGGL